MSSTDHESLSSEKEKPEQTHIPTLDSQQISSKTKLLSIENTFRPPTRTRVKKIARRRSKITHKGANSGDIRNFFTPEQRVAENRVKFVDISNLPGG